MYVAFHFGAILSQEWDVYTRVCVQPEVLVLKVNKALRITQSVCIQLSNATNNAGQETIGVFGDSSSYLYQAIALEWRCVWVFLNEKLVVQMVPLYNIIPTLAEIEFYICCCRSLDNGVRIMPGVGALILHVCAQWCRKMMRWNVPAIKIAI